MVINWINIYYNIYAYRRIEKKTLRVPTTQNNVLYLIFSQKEYK